MLAEFHRFNTDYAGDVWIQRNEGRIGMGGHGKDG